MTEQHEWHIDGRDVFIQEWGTLREMTVEEAESRLNEHETLKGEVEALKPAWVCEFCFACLLDGDLPSDWDLVWQSAICPSCQKKVSDDGGIFKVKGGAYSDGRRDPRTITPNLPQERR